MREKLRAWIIHKLGGFTKQEEEKVVEELRKEIDGWRDRCNDLVDEYGRIETISVRRTLAASPQHAYEWKICDGMMKELFGLICESAGRLVERQHYDDHERNQRTVTMSIKLIRNEHF